MRISAPVAWPRRPRVVMLLGLVLTGSATGVLTGGTTLGRNIQAPTRIVISLARIASTESSTKSATAALSVYNPRDTIYTVMRARGFCAEHHARFKRCKCAPLQPAQPGPVPAAAMAG